MDINNSKNKIVLYFFLFVFYSCVPLSEIDCNDRDHEVVKPDLIVMSPFQQNYNAGDEINFSLVIPSKSTWFSNVQNDIFATTQDSSGRIIFSTFNSILEGNEVTMIKGTQGEYPFWFYLPFNNLNDSYELSFKVKLNRTGNYSMLNNQTESILFQGSSECNRFMIDTDIIGNFPNNTIAFTVQ